MRAKILLVSTNLAVPWLATALHGMVEGCRRARVVTNGEPRRPASGGDARLACEALRRAGVEEIGLVDLLADEPPRPATCDCVCLAGGNPFHLLDSLRGTGADDALGEMLSAGRPVIAAGLAACVLGRTIAHLSEFGLCVPAMGCREKVALGVLPFSVLPSANRWRAVRRDFSETLRRVEARHGRLVGLDDDEALRIGPGLGSWHRLRRNAAGHSEAPDGANENGRLAPAVGSKAEASSAQGSS